MINKKFIDAYLNDIESIARSMPRDDIEKGVELLYEAWKRGRQVFTAGNGGSASTASHLACDLSKFASVEGKRRFRALSLTDNVPLVSAITNDLGWENVYVEQLKNLMHEGDFLVVISVHGGSGSDKAGPWSQNLMKAAKFVAENGGRVVGLAGFDGGVLRQIADVCIVVPINSTPHVEGFHAVLTHLICSCLRNMVSES